MKVTIEVDLKSWVTNSAGEPVTLRQLDFPEGDVSGSLEIFLRGQVFTVHGMPVEIDTVTAQEE